MKITNIKIKLMPKQNDHLKAFCTVELDDELAIHKIKIIERSGDFFVAMPSDKLSDRCGKCGGKNHVQAKFCNDCGGRLAENRVKLDAKGKTMLYVDIAHPINPRFRQKLHDTVIHEFLNEVERSKLPGYKPMDRDTPE